MFASLLDELAARRQEIEKLEAQWLTKVAAYDRSGEWDLDGHASAAGALRTACRMTHAAARQSVAVARKLEKLPDTAGAFAAGEISRRHAEVIADAYTPERAEGLADIEPALVRAAKLVDPRSLRVDFVMYAVDALDGDGGAAREASQYERRALHASTTFDGMVVIDGTCDAATGAVITTALDAEMERDRVQGDGRSTAQRRLDALANLCRRALDTETLGTRHGSRPHVSIVINLDDLPGSTPALVDQLRVERRRLGHLTPATLEQILCDCTLTRVLTTGGSEVLDVGHAQRTVTSAQWKALVVRDRHCQAPGCDRPPERCEAHHIEHWEHSGPTNLDNLQLLCWAHHRQHHTKHAQEHARTQHAA
jgi:Domain of unknown function (DUF222)/HNH endonuclease